MPRADKNANTKRGPGRPPKLIPQNAQKDISKKVIQPQEEPRKKIINCSSTPPTLFGRPVDLKRKGRSQKSHNKTRIRNRQRPQQPADTESTSEDDIPSSFSDVVKIIIQKVQETQVGASFSTEFQTFKFNLID